MKKRISRLLYFLMPVVFLLGGCGTQKEDMVPIKVGITDDIVSLDVAGTKDILSETVGRCVFSTLYTFDEKLNLSPCLAENAEQVSELEWIFKLRDDVKFHDGTPLAASDVVFSIHRAMNIEKAEHSLLVIADIEALNDKTVKVTTTDQMNNLPTLFVRTSTSVMSEKAMSNPDYDVNKPVGSGPFKVIERTERKEIRLERFDDYFGGAAKSRYLSFVVEPSEPNSTAMLLNGKLDILYRVAANDGDYLDLNESVNLYQTDSTKTELLILNPRVAPINDICVRQAIACAIDKQSIIDNVLSGFGKAQSSIIPAPILGFADFKEYSYNPEKARELLAQAGYPDGFDFTVLTFDSQRKKLMEYLKMDFAEVNINLNYEFLELQEYLDIVGKGTQMGSIMSWTSNPDPDSTLTQLFSKAGHPTVNQSGFTNPRVEELLEQGRMETNTEAREAIYQEANQIIAGSYYAVPLYQPAVLVAARADVAGVCVNPQGIFGYENLYRKNQ